ncbi:Heterokaryon incompatibility protein [Paramyrothecium foliicola]|nr:Heterokaryon incompatibility protein [Paramyrothecium foliicola]
MAVFIHDALSSENPEIRLVRFINGPDEPLALELQHKPRNDSIDYAAISYTWGDMRNTVEVMVNGRYLSVRRNLYDCLLQLWIHSVESWLWADGLCINQTDLEEKKHAVAGMDVIFHNARLVYAWLGLQSPGTDQVMSWIEWIGSQAPHGFLESLESSGPQEQDIHLYISSRRPDQLNDDDADGRSEIARFLYTVLNSAQMQGPDFRSGAHDLFRRDYWHRIWVIQEIALANSVSFMCGAKSVWVEDLDTTLSAMRYCTRRGLFHLQREYEGFNFIPVTYDIKPLIIRRKKNFGLPIYLQDILFENVVAPERPHYSATDPRDLAFALAGLVSDESRQRLTVDYKWTVEEVFAMMTKIMLLEPSHHESLSLDWCTPKEGDISMPSWAPDWTTIGRYGIRVWNIAYSASFDTAMGMKAPPQLRNDVPMNVPFLHYHGNNVDIITDVLEPPRYRHFSEWDVPQLENTTSWLASILQFVELGPESGPGEDYIWRSVLLGYSTLQSGFHNTAMSEEVLQLIRCLLRRKPIDAVALSKIQTDFIRRSIVHPDIMAEQGNIQAQLQYFLDHGITSISTNAIMNRRTFFKTSKAMFGVGHQAVKVGDIVTTLWGVRSPIILRKRDAEPGYLFVGDAYVDGIMYGEFQKTEPRLCEFHIY